MKHKMKDLFVRLCSDTRIIYRDTENLQENTYKISSSVSTLHKVFQFDSKLKQHLVSHEMKHIEWYICAKHQKKYLKKYYDDHQIKCNGQKE